MTAPKYPRLMVPANTHVRLSKIAAKRKMTLTAVTARVIAAGLKTLHW